MLAIIELNKPNTILDDDTEENIHPWTATYLCTQDDFNGNAAVYEMNPPHGGYKKVIVSAVDGAFAYETYILVWMIMGTSIGLNCPVVQKILLATRK